MPLSFGGGASIQNIQQGLCCGYGYFGGFQSVRPVGASRAISLAAARGGRDRARRDLFGAPGDLDDDEPAVATVRHTSQQRGTVGARAVRSSAEPVQAGSGEEDRLVHGRLLPSPSTPAQTGGESQHGGIDRTSPQPTVGVGT